MVCWCYCGCSYSRISSSILTPQLANWLASKGLFGARDLNIQVPQVPTETTRAAWCLAKIGKLIHPVPKSEEVDYAEEFKLAEVLLRKDLIKLGTLRQELERLEVSSDCIGFTEHLLVVDYVKRPSAIQALDHPWLRNVS
jgi:hypothetical protein